MVPLPVDPFVLALLALAAVVSLVALGYGIAELRLAVLVLRSRPSAVLETPGGGPVELRGTAKPVGGVLRSPFTETPCLAYEYVVEEERDSKNGRHWTTVASGDEYLPFRLDDGSGSVLIEPPGADFRLATDARIEVDGGTEPPAPIARFIDRTEDLDSENTSIDLRVFELRTGRDRRFVERRLEPGETVHVLGTARYDPSASSAAGDVNAAVGIDERALSPSRWLRLRHRLFGHPFVIAEGSERWLGLRAGAVGLASILGGVAALGFVVAVAV
ncbi:GIDE domain-containing protein [Halopiger aswanensis]|uniref:RING-type E3 ubiquitin transferase n=1 Tax=Halopiger aswanensis TaxID=148449 RepID=A0A3R7DFX3_9EURY|nr:GIDE domain-containing protein [Halopiger aswanensis]RKD98275.1 E3 ubiquitin ligase [Halopiger aswanensis]